MLLSSGCELHLCSQSNIDQPSHREPQKAKRIQNRHHFENRNSVIVITHIVINLSTTRRKKSPESASDRRRVSVVSSSRSVVTWYLCGQTYKVSLRTDRYHHQTASTTRTFADRPLSSSNNSNNILANDIYFLNNGSSTRRRKR